MHYWTDVGSHGSYRMRQRQHLWNAKKVTNAGTSYFEQKYYKKMTQYC